MLNVLTKEDAISAVREQTANILPEIQTVSIFDASGRTLARDIVSAENIPAFDRSTVDGFAVFSADTFGASNGIPAQLEIAGEILMGEKAGLPLERGRCFRISTGGMLPEGADAAVMSEYTDTAGKLCLIYKAASPFENVTKKGDDIAAGKTALKKGARITAAETGVLAALGVHEVPVFKKPVIAVISTGDELTEDAPAPGQIRDVNTYLLTAAARELGCEALVYGAVKDSEEQIKRAVADCLKKADAVLISGGSSAGAKDMTVKIIDELGKVFFHGIAMKPGKPTIFGVADGKPVFGLPGHPLAAYFVFRLIVSEYVRNVLCSPADKPLKTAALAVNIPSNHGREEFICVKTNESNEVFPLRTKSGVISVLSEAEGFIRIPRGAEGLDRGTSVDIYGL